MIQEVSVESTQETPASSLEPGSSASVPKAHADAPEPAEQEPAQPQEPQESQEPVPEEPAEEPPPPVPKTRVPPRVKPKAKPKAEPTQVLAESAPKAKAKRAPRKPPEGSSASVRNAQDPPPDETDRFAQYSNTDLMSEMLKRTDQGERRNSTLHTALIAEIIARSNDHRMEQKKAMYRSFLQ